MASEGYPFILITLFSAVVTGLSGFFYSNGVLYTASVFLILLTVFILYFFRDPEREFTAEDKEIVSPGDGLVVTITDENESDYFEEKVKRISIFLSVFDVHINRIPINGKVDFLEYKKGRFKAAFKEEASSSNEQTVIGIVNNYGKVLFKQIAGLIARRIVCHLEEGEKVNAGERFGMIRFGSRIDVLLPANVEILIHKGDRVVGGKTIIGRFKDEKKA